MSIHKSLASKGKLIRTRNVLKRAERIHELELSGRWKPDAGSPYGLPKVRVLKVKKRVKEKKKEEGEAAKAPGVEGAPAPAAAGAKGQAAAPGAKPAAGGKETKAAAGKEGKK